MDGRSLNSPRPVRTDAFAAGAGAGTDFGALPAASVPQPDPVPLIPSHRLLQGHGSVRILHNGAIYRLQMTRHDKLILTK